MKVLPLRLRNMRDLLDRMPGPPADTRVSADRPEAFVVRSVEQIRAMGLDADPRMVLTAKARGRRQGLVAGLAGAASATLVDAIQLLDETIVGATVARQWAPTRDAFGITCDLLVLWELAPDEAAAAAGLEGRGDSVAERWIGGQLPPLPGSLRVRASLAWLWQSRKALVKAKAVREAIRSPGMIPGLGLVTGPFREGREREEWVEKVQRLYGALPPARSSEGAGSAEPFSS